MIKVQSVQFYQLQGINIQQDFSGNIYGSFHRETLLNELASFKEDSTGCVKFKCEKRKHPAKNGKPYTHLAPAIEVIIHPNSQVSDDQLLDIDES